MLILSSGYVWSYMFSLYVIYPQLSAQLEGEDIQLSGYISEVKSESHQFSKFIFNVGEASIAQLNSNIPSKVVLSWYQPEQKIQHYQECKFVVRLKKIWGYSNPGGVDYEKNMFIAGIGARGYVRSGQCDQAYTVIEKPNLRQTWIAEFRAIASHYKYSHLMQALTFGYRENISQQQWGNIT